MPSIPIIMPQLGESIAEAAIISFLVKPGDQVEGGQDLIEVETNKATMTVTAPCGGRLEIFSAQLNESYAVGDVLGKIEASKEEAARFGLDVAPPPKTSETEHFTAAWSPRFAVSPCPPTPPARAICRPASRRGCTNWA
jgi:pyruvate/2-oxoglutarate dehydrogenase complex dihydrolipoamide acyltransferase (E2) component